MRCPDDAELARWADGLVPEDRAREIVEHLAECLECRLAAGPPRAAGQPSSPPNRGPAPGRPFEDILAILRFAYGTVPGSEPTRHDDLIGEDIDLPLLMAADSGARPWAASIPSLYGEEGKLVVTFRVDPDSGVATAYFISRDVDRIRFRALLVGSEVLLSDTEGKAPLKGYSAEELLGMRISVPATLVEGSIELPAASESSASGEIELRGGSDPPLSTSAEVRFDRASGGCSLLLTLRRSDEADLGAVLIADDARAEFLRFGATNSVMIDWNGDLPRKLRLTILALS